MLGKCGPTLWWVIEIWSRACFCFRTAGTDPERVSNEFDREAIETGVESGVSTWNHTRPNYSLTAVW